MYRAVKLAPFAHFVRYAERPPFYADSFGFSTGMYDSTDDPNIPTPRTRIDELVIQMLAHDAAKRPSLAKIMMTLKQVVVYDFPESGDLRPLQNLRVQQTLSIHLHACAHVCMYCM